MNIKCSLKRYIRYIYWSLAIISLFVPVIIKLTYNEPMRWTITLAFPILILAMYPAWKFGLFAISFASVFEYLVEFFLIPTNFDSDFPQLVVNSTLNWILFMLVALFILHYHEKSEQLRASEERYRKIVELSPKGIVIHREGTILYANPSAMKIVKEDNLVGKSIFTYLHPDFHEISKQRISQAKIGKEIPIIEEKLIRHDGKMIDAEIGGVSINYDGSPATLIIFSDVSERKKVEQALQESEKRYRRLVEWSPEPIIVYQHGFIQYANPACIKLLGASSLEELIGKSIIDYIHPDFVHLVENRNQEINQTGIFVAPTEEKIIRLDGTVIDVEVTGTTIKHDGKPTFLMMYHDLTGRKRTEEALRKSEEKYRLIAENMTDLVSVLDENGIIKYASPSHEFVLGFTPEVYEGNLAFDFVHSDDIPHIQSKFLYMVLSKENKVIEFRYKHINGNWVWVEAKGTPVFNEEGNLLHFLVVAREITERRLYEERLSHMAYHDTLTGLPNRRLFKERLEQSLKEAERYGRKMAVMYMDMDKFKHINDTFGHGVGDELLIQFAQRVQGCLRESDTLARQGGDEFIILLPEIQEEQDALQIAKRILAALQEPWLIGELVLQTTSSIGISFYPKDGTTRHELMNHADTALYEAKEDGKNNFKTYSLLRVR